MIIQLFDYCYLCQSETIRCQIYKSFQNHQFIIREMENQPFKVVHIQTLQNRVVGEDKYFDGRQIWNPKNLEELYIYQETCKPTFEGRFNNGFFTAFLQAYNNHADVKLTPDDVWLAISLYFTEYVNDHSEELRKAFVSHQGKKELIVVTSDEFQETKWNEFFDKMIVQIKKHTSQGVTDKLQSNFSTTKRVQKIFSTATIMNTYKNYFEYTRVCFYMCGIQNIHFGGTLQDWKRVHQKLLNLAQFDVNGDLKKYIKYVSQILVKFIETYEGKVDLQFWNSVIDRRGSGGSGGGNSKYSGWLTYFFGYYRQVQKVKINALDFPIKIINLKTGITKEVQLVGGFTAVSKQGRVYRPHMSMAIRDNSGRPFTK